MRNKWNVRQQKLSEDDAVTGADRYLITGKPKTETKTSCQAGIGHISPYKGASSAPLHLSFQFIIHTKMKTKLDLKRPDNIFFAFCEQKECKTCVYIAVLLYCIIVQFS